MKGAANIPRLRYRSGAWAKLVGNGDSDPHLEEDMERLSLTNEALIAAIESLTEEIKGSSGQQATELYEKQMERLDEAEAIRGNKCSGALRLQQRALGHRRQKVLQQKNRRCHER